MQCCSCHNYVVLQTCALAIISELRMFELTVVTNGAVTLWFSVTCCTYRRGSEQLNELNAALQAPNGQLEAAKRQLDACTAESKSAIARMTSDKNDEAFALHHRMQQLQDRTQQMESEVYAPDVVQCLHRITHCTALLLHAECNTTHSIVVLLLVAFNESI
jgi:hypothetical protein